MTARLTILLAAALGVGALVAGCGDDGSNSDTTVTTSSLTKPQFVKQASAICTKGHEDILAYEPPDASGMNQKAEFQESVNASVLPTLESVVEEVRDLGAPEGDAPQIEALLSSMEEGIETLEAEEESLSSVQDIEKPMRASGKLAREYDLEACSFGR